MLHPTSCPVGDPHTADGTRAGRRDAAGVPVEPLGRAARSRRERDAAAAEARGLAVPRLAREPRSARVPRPARVPRSARVPRLACIPRWPRACERAVPHRSRSPQRSWVREPAAAYGVPATRPRWVATPVLPHRRPRWDAALVPPHRHSQRAAAPAPPHGSPQRAAAPAPSQRSRGHTGHARPAPAPAPPATRPRTRPPTAAPAGARNAPSHPPHPPQRHHSPCEHPTPGTRIVTTATTRPSQSPNLPHASAVPVETHRGRAPGRGVAPTTSLPKRECGRSALMNR